MKSSHVRKHRPVEAIRLPRWLRWSIYAASLSLFATGAAWLVLHYALRSEGEFGSLPHPLEPWMMRLHGMAMIVALFLYGTLLRSHMVRAWQVRRNRVTGIVSVAVLLALALSGYLLYYAADEDLRATVSVVHWAIGLVLGAALPVHVWWGRRRAAASELAARAIPLASRVAKSETAKAGN